MNESFGTVRLECTGCGASLDITPNLEVFSCGYCGARQMVRRSGGSVSLKPLEEAISRVQRGTDRTASELAVPRLKEEMVALDNERKNMIAALKISPGTNDGCLAAFATVFVSILVSAVIWTEGHFVVGFFCGSLVLAIGVVSSLKLNQAWIDRANSQLEEKMLPIEQEMTPRRAALEAELQEHLALLRNPNL